MKKPVIKNWIKYWTTTIAVSGMLALGACDSNNENNTTDNLETATEETVTSTRENVSQGMEDLEAETDAETEEVAATEENTATNVNQTQYETTSSTTNTGTSPERSATFIDNMDAHLDEHEAANEAVREELTETELNNQNSTNAASGVQTEQQSTSGTMETQNQQNQTLDYSAEQQGSATGMDNQSTTNPTQQQNSLDNQPQDSLSTPQGTLETQQGTTATETREGNTTVMNQQEQDDQSTTTFSNNENSSGLEEAEDPNTPAAIYERHIAVYPEGMSEYAQQRFNAIMSDYKERRESMRGQVNNETGAYLSADVDPQPTVGFDEIETIIQRNIDYPETAAAAEVEGIAFVNLVVDENGNIEEVKATDEFIEANSNYPQSFTEEDIERAKEDLKKEAERATKETSGLWEAAEQNGEKVKSEIQIPVRFILKDLGVGEYEDLGTGRGNPTEVTE